MAGPTEDIEGGGMLERRQPVPFFEVVTVEGVRVCYSELWQRRTLLLVSTSGSEGTSLLAALRARIGGDAEVVVTSDIIEGLPQPGVVVADRWGEIQHAARLGHAAPDPAELAEWVHFVQVQCPECEGETR